MSGKFKKTIKGYVRSKKGTLSIPTKDGLFKPVDERKKLLNALPDLKGLGLTLKALKIIFDERKKKK